MIWVSVSPIVIDPALTGRLDPASSQVFLIAAAKGSKPLHQPGFSEPVGKNSDVWLSFGLAKKSIPFNANCVLKQRFLFLILVILMLQICSLIWKVFITKMELLKLMI